MSGSFTVYHDGQFWVGVLEVASDEGVRAARHVFGPEPTNAELLAFAAGPGFDALSRAVHAAPPVPAGGRPTRRVNARRAAKLAARSQAEQGIGTAAQRALKESLTRRLSESAGHRRRLRSQQEEHRRAVARAKAKARRRGR